MGGNVPSHEEVLRLVHELARREGRNGQPLDKPTLDEERMANV